MSNSQRIVVPDGDQLQLSLVRIEDAARVRGSLEQPSHKIGGNKR
jgi:hypothetical protein